MKILIQVQEDNEQYAAATKGGDKGSLYGLLLLRYRNPVHLIERARSMQDLQQEAPSLHQASLPYIACRENKEGRCARDTNSSSLLPLLTHLLLHASTMRTQTRSSQRPGYLPAFPGLQGLVSSFHRKT
jgi:hypothetical protein